MKIFKPLLDAFCGGSGLFIFDCLVEVGVVGLEEGAGGGVLVCLLEDADEEVGGADGIGVVGVAEEIGGDSEAAAGVVFAAGKFVCFGLE